MKFAVIEKTSVNYEDGDRFVSHNYDVFTEFKDEEDMRKYVESSAKSVYSPKYKLISFQELAVKTTIEIDFGVKQC